MSRAAGVKRVIPADAVLLPIDMQVGFGAPGAPALSSNPDGPGLRLLAAWRASGRAVIHVRHDSVQPGSAFRLTTDEVPVEAVPADLEAVLPAEIREDAREGDPEFRD